jgi:4-alpha-glucanotransferase
MHKNNSFLSPEQKLGGILTPLSAVRGHHDIGIGDTESLVELAEWAAKKGFRLIQILPVNETGNDNSPYNLISSIAYEPCTLATNPRWLPDLSEADFKKITKKHNAEALREGKVQYKAVKAMKRELLAAAFKTLESEKGNRTRIRHFEKFVQDESEWLAAYAMFRALGAWNDNDEVVSNWPESHRSPAAAREWLDALEPKKRRQFEELVRFFSYIQWVAMSQWKAVRAAFDKLGVALMGDIPVGVSIYSADVWAEPGIFDCSRSSGAPPEKIFKSDPFTENWGQNWGFPLYNWEAMSRDNFAWWRRRLEISREVFHLLRVDHALGFFRIWNFPWRPEENARFTYLTPEQAQVITGGRLPGFTPFDDSTESNREYNRRQGEMLFKVFVEETGPHRLIAEDLGEMSPYVRPTLEALEIPGFKIPMWEVDEDGKMLPGSSYQRLSLATFATHDHPTIRQYWEDWSAEAAKTGKGAKAKKEMREILDFCGHPEIPVPCDYTPEVHAAFIHGLFASNSWLVVHQITDIFGSRERFNVPGAVGDQNWTTRVEGEIKDWDKLYKNELLMCSLALRETGRIPASGKH